MSPEDFCPQKSPRASPPRPSLQSAPSPTASAAHPGPVAPPTAAGGVRRRVRHTRLGHYVRRQRTFAPKSRPARARPAPACCRRPHLLRQQPSLALLRLPQQRGVYVGESVTLAWGIVSPPEDFCPQESPRARPPRLSLQSAPSPTASAALPGPAAPSAAARDVRRRVRHTTLGCLCARDFFLTQSPRARPPRLSLQSAPSPIAPAVALITLHLSQQQGLCGSQAFTHVWGSIYAHLVTLLPY
jgi:hypothetical protein